MTFDLNDAELPRSSDLIPDGSFAKVTMALRPGGVDGEGELDRGLLKLSNTPGSDVRMLDTEFTVISGPHARRKFWQQFTVQGGKVDEHGVSIGWKISKGMFRAMVDSALGLDPQDMSEAAKAQRKLRGLRDLHGITFVAKIRVEPSTNPDYGDTNRLDRVVLPGEPEYARVMAGETVPPQPSHRPAKKAAAPKAPAPSWGPPQARPVAATPAWAPPASSAPAPAAPPSPVPKPSGGPAWLNG